MYSCLAATSFDFIDYFVGGLKCCRFVNSGADANSLYVKILDALDNQSVIT